MIIRVLLAVLALILGFVGPWWLFAAMLAIHVFIYTGIEVIFIAMLVDAFFGYGSSFPFLYTAGTGALLLAVHLLRPVLFIYQK